MKQQLLLALAMIIATGGFAQNDAPSGPSAVSYPLQQLPATHRPAARQLQTQGETMQTITPTFTRPLAKQTSASNSLERIKALFTNRGNSDDSIVFFYGTGYRGSNYDDNFALAGFVGGAYHPTINFTNRLFPIAVLCDSFHYIGRSNPANPYQPYFNTYYAYRNDSAQQEMSGRSDQALIAGGFGPGSRYTNTYEPRGGNTSQTKFNWDASLGQYDTTGIINTSYYDTAKIQTQEAYQFIAPYPTRRGFFSGRTVNYYTTAGKLYRTDEFDWNGATGAWHTQASVINILSFDAAGRTATSSTYRPGSDTFQSRYSYDVAGRMLSDSVRAWNAKLNFFGNWDTVSTTATRYFYPASPSSDWTGSKRYVRDAATKKWSKVDSVARTLDASNRVLSSYDNYDDGGFNDINILVRTYNAAGRITTSFSSDQDVTDGDTISTIAVISYDSYNLPLTRLMYNTEAYGNPAPDTFNVSHDRFYYEKYTRPAAQPNGVATTMKKIALIIFPNPTNGTLHLSCGEMGEAVLTITSLNGSVLRRHALQLGNNEAVLDVSGLAPGAYFIRLQDPQQGLQAAASFIVR